MRICNFLRLGLFAVFLAALSGCGGSEEQDIREWMKEESKGLKGRVPDLPEIKPLPVLSYEPGDLTSPFAPDKVFAEEKRAAGKVVVSGGPKDVNIDAFPMAKYPLESIRLVGTLKLGNEWRAVVAADREPVRQVRVGDYIGQNHGRITAIEPAVGDSPGLIQLKEVVLEKGVWIERESRLPPLDQRR
jgi:type IV pilus assembly protein PilP